MILTSILMLLLIETNIDLSGGSGVYLSGVTCALLVVKCGWPIFPAIVVTIMVGIMMGAVNGFFIGRIGLPAFIVTLAAQQIFRGTGYVPVSYTHLLNAVELLKDMGLRACFVTDGETGVRYAADAKDTKDPYELIIIDWKMPCLLYTSRCV